MIIHYFQKKHIAIQQARNEGFRAGKDEIRKQYEKKIQRIKSDVSKMISKKNDEIHWRDKYIEDIQRELDLHMDNLAEAKHIMQQIEQNKNIEILELAKRQQEIQKTIDQVVSIARRTKFQGVQKKIELYEIKKLGG